MKGKNKVSIYNTEMYISDETTERKLVVKGKKLYYRWVGNAILVSGRNEVKFKIEKEKRGRI